MSISATSPSWNAVEIASLSPNSLDRPLQNGLRLLALELDRQLAGLEIVEQLDVAHAATSSRRLFAGSRPARRPSSSSLVRSQNARKLSSPLTLPQPPVQEAGDRVGEVLGRDPAEHRPGDRRVGAEAAAQQQVVGLAAHAFLVPHRRALEAEIADPVVRAGVRAAVEVQLQPGERVAEACLEVLDEGVEPRLGLGRRRSCSAARRCTRSLRSEAGCLRAAARAPPAARRPGRRRRPGSDVKTKFCCRVTRTSSAELRASSRRDHLLAGEQADFDRDSDRDQAFLLLRLALPCDRSSAAARRAGSRAVRSRAVARPRRACPQARCRRP